MRMILAIDPGTTKSGWVLLQTDYQPFAFGKDDNELVSRMIKSNATVVSAVVIEMVSSYGERVGREVFETCVWIGRFTEVVRANGGKAAYVYRGQEKSYICHNQKANDAAIRRALIERFAKHDLRNGKGTREDPDVFFGVSGDAWSAIAVGVTFLDILAEAHEKPVDAPHGSDGQTVAEQ